jgi:hypothetical protein
VDAQPTQPQIDAAVAAALAAARRASPDPGRVFGLPYAPADAEATRRPDGWCEVGAVVDGARGRLRAVEWHHRTARTRLR